MNLIFGQINNRLSVITHKSPNLWVITNRLSLFIFGE